MDFLFLTSSEKKGPTSMVPINFLGSLRGPSGQSGALSAYAYSTIINVSEVSLSGLTRNRPIEGMQKDGLIRDKSWALQHRSGVALPELKRGVERNESLGS